MKRWDSAGMVAIGRTLFAKIHKQKRHANPNHDIHFMARELDDWLVQGVASMVDDGRWCNISSVI